jgi:acetyl-CoA carboxylase carboxyl transferase subunit alpha
MMENAVYSVITAGGAAIWKDRKALRCASAHHALRMTAPSQDLKVIDEIIPEPVGGAHTNHEAAAAALQESIRNSRTSDGLPDKLVRRRREKFLRMGQWAE